MDKLFIVIPAYNEEENIEAVAREWHDAVAMTGNESRLLIIDDGSKDETFAKLNELKRELTQLDALTKPNGGHGASLLFGYQYALDNGADYVFQTDSDGQTLPSEFGQLWENRTDYDFLIGSRRGRQDGVSRVLVTKVLKLVLFLQFGIWIADANTPFRLMSASSLKELLPLIPKDYNLSNVLLTVLYHKRGKRIKFYPITFRPRQGGVNSINFKKITVIGRKAVSDFASLKKDDSFTGK